jgi:hypothetical protein
MVRKEEGGRMKAEKERQRVLKVLLSSFRLPPSSF